MPAEGPSSGEPRTRIQKRNQKAILAAALKVFSQNGFRGATLEQIATTSGLSKQNVIYYFGSKDKIYAVLLEDLLDVWLDPMRDLRPTDDPVEQLVRYVLRKLEMSRTMPHESRLFANEIVQGAPHILDNIRGPLKEMVDEKAALIAEWVEAGKIAPLDPHHLIFSIWATTQHYADFDVQIRGILRPKGAKHFEDAATYLADLYRRALTPD